MAIRTAESLKDEFFRTKDKAQRALLKQCELLVRIYDENYLRSEMTQILDRIRSYKDVAHETLEYNGTSDTVKSEISALKKKLKPFKIILY